MKLIGFQSFSKSGSGSPFPALLRKNHQLSQWADKREVYYWSDLTSALWVSSLKLIIVYLRCHVKISSSKSCDPRRLHLNTQNTDRSDQAKCADVFCLGIKHTEYFLSLSTSLYNLVFLQWTLLEVSWCYLHIQYSRSLKATVGNYRQSGLRNKCRICLLKSLNEEKCVLDLEYTCTHPLHKFSNDIKWYLVVFIGCAATVWPKARRNTLCAKPSTCSL